VCRNEGNAISDHDTSHRCLRREEADRGVSWHIEVQAAMERHVGTLRQNHTDRCLPCRNCTTKNLQTRGRQKGMVASSPDRHRQHTPEPMPSLPTMPPTPPGDNEGAQSSQIDNLPPSYVYSHTPLPCAQFFNLDAYAQDSQHDEDFNPDIPTGEGTSTG